MKPRKVEKRKVETREVESRPTERKRKVKLDNFRLKLATEQREGYVRRWIVEENIHERQEMDYEFVQKSTGVQVGDEDISQREGLDSRVSRVVGKKEDGTPQYAYLMEKREDWYKEDQEAEVQERVKEVQDSMQRAEDDAARQVGNVYTPRTGRKIKSGLQ